MSFVQTNILVMLPVFYIVSWQLTQFNGIVSCQEATQNMRLRATRTQPGAAMQAFMSKMMSLIPANASEDLFGGIGYSTGPNLGYEPYWTDVTDLEWEDRCKRCTTLFRKYKEVCAVDDTGDVYVNTSLCGMLWQNCLAGNAKGTVNSTAGYSPVYKDYYVVADGWARFSARIDIDFIVLLSNKPTRTPPYYEICLDFWNGAESVIYKDGHYTGYYFKSYYGIRALKPNEFTELVIRWDRTSGWLLITRSSYTNWTQGFYLNYTDPNPFDIKYISVASAYGHHGDFILNGFTVENLGPCDDISSAGIPRTLRTNPTDIPVVNKYYSEYNRGYYTRLAAAGLDPEKKSFSTREEY